MDTVTSFVQDNLLLTILIVAALALLFLIVVIVVIIIIRRRRMVDDEELPPVPEAPFAQPSYQAPQAGVGAPADYGAPTGLAGSTEWPDQSYAPAPDFSGGGLTAPPTQAAGGPPAAPFGVATTTAPGGAAPPPPPPFVPQVARPAAAGAGGTQILDRGPKMPVVALLISRQRPNQRFDVSKPVVTVGRAQTSDVLIDDGTISRQHATIKWEEDRFRVYDLGSSNGTFVGDERVRAPIALEDGSVVRFGGVELVFKIVSLNA